MSRKRDIWGKRGVKGLWNWYKSSRYFPFVLEDVPFNALRWRVNYIQFMHMAITSIGMAGMLFARDYTLFQYLLLLITPRWVYKTQKEYLVGWYGCLMLFLLIPYGLIVWGLH